MKKVRIVFLLVLCFCSDAAFCQKPEKIRIGARAGIDRVYFRNYLGANHWSVGYTSGIDLEFRTTDKLSFLIGAAFANRKINAGVVWISSPNNPISENLFSERHLKIVEFLPVGIRYRFSNKANPVKLNPFVQIGLITSFSFSDKRVVVTDAGATSRNYPGFRAYKQGVELGGGAEYTLNKKASLMLLLTSRLTRVPEDFFRFVPESRFDKIAAQAGFTYGF
jgi:hypothetical protein